MTWADFYLICFLLGLALSLLSVLTGSAHLHLPHVHVPGLHIPHVPGAHVPHVHAPETAEAEGVPWLNFGTMTAFLAWFGGTGYLLERFYAVWFVVALAIAMLSGLGGAAIVFWFLSKLASDDAALDPADYEMVGVLGKLSYSDPRRRDWRDDLLAGGRAPRYRRALGRWDGHTEGHRSSGRAV